MKAKAFLYLYLILLILSPFVGYLSITTLNTGPKNLFSALTFLIFLAFIFDSITTKRKIFIPKYLWLYFLFIIYTIFSDKLLVGKSLGVKYFYSNYKLTAFLVIVMIENTRFSKREMRTFFKLMIFTVLTAFIVILLQQFYSSGFFVNLNSETMFKNINFSNDYSIRLPSIYSWIGLLEMGLGFTPMLAIIMEYYMLKKKRSKYWLAYFFLGLIYVLLTRYRWEMVNVVVLIIIPIIHYKARLSKLVVNGILLMILMYAGLALSSNFGIPIYDIIENRVLEKSHGGLEKGSASTRILAVYIFSQLYPEHPVFGKGDFHTFNARTDKDFALAAALGGRSSQIHVGYLSLLYYYGIVGGLLFLSAIYFLMKRLYARAKLTSQWAPFFGLLGFVLANFTLVEFSLFHAGLIMALVFDKYFLTENSLKPEDLPGRYAIRNK